MDLATNIGPTLPQRLLRHLGKLNLPKLNGLYERTGILGVSRPRVFECAFDGFRYRGRLDQRIDKHIYFFGAYSPGELDFLGYAASVLGREREGISFIDIGANVGQHTLFMSRRVSKVLAFEPGDKAADQLESNLQLNGVTNVSLVRVALGSEDGTAQLGSGFPGNSGSRSLNWSLDPAENSTVSVRRGDDQFDKHGLARADIIKMDVEGHEKETIAGMARTLLRDRPVLLFELVVSEIKGGYRSEKELRSSLYPDHVLYSLQGSRKARLLPFSWSSEEAVCIPRELSPAFESLIPQSLIRQSLIRK